MPCLQLKVSCQQLFRCLFHNCGPWGKCFFGSQGIYSLKYQEWPLGQLSSKAERRHRIQLSKHIHGSDHSNVVAAGVCLDSSKQKLCLPFQRRWLRSALFISTSSSSSWFCVGEGGRYSSLCLHSSVSLYTWWATQSNHISRVWFKSFLLLRHCPLFHLEIRQTTKADCCFTVTLNVWIFNLLVNREQSFERIK